MFNDIEVKGFQQKFDNLDMAVTVGNARATIDDCPYYVIHDTLRDEYFLEGQAPTIRNYEKVVWQSN